MSNEKKYIVTVWFFGGGGEQFTVTDQNHGADMMNEWVDYMSDKPLNSWHIRSFTRFPGVKLRFDAIVSISVREYAPTPTEQVLAMQEKLMDQECKGDEWKRDE